MGQTVKLRRSAVPGKVPNNSQLQLGELSVNTSDGKVFFAKSGSLGPSIEEIITTNTQNTGSIDLVGALTASVISGSFIGDGSNLYGIPASGVTGLSLDRIASSTSTASIDEDGLHINTDTTVTGSLTATEFTGSGLGLTNVPINISGSSHTATNYDESFTKFYFDDSTGIKVEGDSTTGVAKIYLDGVASEGGGEGTTKLLTVATPSSVWTFNHGLGEQYPTITVFDSDDNVIIPQNIEAVSSTQLVVSFASPQAGFVTATIGGGLPSYESTDSKTFVVENGTPTWKDGILSGSISFNSYTSSVDSSIDSIRDDFNTHTSSVSGINTDQTDRLNSLESFTGSIDETYATDEDVNELRGDLNAYTSSTDGRLGSLETISSSHDGRLDSIESKTGSFLIDSDLSTLEGQVGSLQTESGSIRTTLNSYTSSNDTKNTEQDNRLSSLEVQTGSLVGDVSDLSGRVNSLETTSGSHNTRIGNLETFKTNVDQGLEFTGSNVTIKGDLLVKGTETRVNSTTVEISDNVISLNGSGAANGGIEVRDVTSPNLLSGSLIWDGLENKWKGGSKGSEDNLVLEGDFNTFTSSVDGTMRDDFNQYTSSTDDNLESLESFTSSIDDTIKTKLNTETVVSGSDQVVTLLSNRDLNLGSGDLTAVTGSFGDLSIDDTIQATNFTGSFLRLDQNGSGMRMTNVGAFDNDGSDNFRIFSTNDLIISTGGDAGTTISLDGSTKDATFQGNIILSGTVDGVDVSGLKTSFDTTTGSLDGRLDSLESFTGSIDETYATDEDVNQLRGDLNSYTSSNDSTNTTQNSRLTSLESETGSYTTTDYFTTGATFNSGDGVVTGTRNDGGTWTVDLDGRYLTSFTETDPIFTASPSAGIAETDITNWDTAYGWGDHSQVGYITGFTNTNEFTTGATFNSSDGIITFTRNNGGDTFTVDIDGKYAESGHNHDSDYLKLTGGQLTGDLVLRNNTAGDDAIVRDITWNSTSAEGTDDRLGLIRVYTSAGGSTSRGGKMNFYTRQSNSGNFNTMTFDRSGNLYVPSNIFSNSQQLATQTWVGSQNYLTSFTETDPIFTASPSAGITDENITNWDTAYGWGDHSQVGYITGFTNTNEFVTGATFNNGDGVVTFTRNNGGDTFTVDLDGRYLTSFTETDPIFTASPSSGIAETDITNWDTAYGWGDHSQGGYLTTYNDEYTTGATFNGSNGIITFTRNDGDTFTLDISSTLTDITVTGGTYNDGTQTLTLNKSDGGSIDVTGFAVDTVLHTTGATFNTSDGVVTFTKNGGDTYTVDLDGRYLTSFTETDPIFTASPSAGIEETDITNWDTAYGWGDHSQGGYLTGFTETDTLDDVVQRGGTTSSWITVGSLLVSNTAPLIDLVDTNSFSDVNDRFRIRAAGNAGQVRWYDASSTTDTVLMTFNPDGTIGIDGNIDMGTNTITDTKVGQWDTAYGWGDHSQVGYITGYTDTNEFTTGATFNSSNGVVTFTRNNGGDTFNVDLDGRYLTSVTNISGYSGTLLAEDNRTISPSEVSANLMKFGFTSWNNNNSGPYADFLHLRSYMDSSGGNDNLVMFKKSGIGMRIWQQGWGSTTAYSSYEDVWTTGGITTTQVSNWDTAYGWGDHASVGYITGYTDTNEFTTGVTFNDGNGVLTFTRNNGGDTFTVDLDGRYLTSFAETDPIFTASPSAGIAETDITNWDTAYGWGDHSQVGYITGFTETDPIFTASEAFDITATNKSNWNTAYGWGDHSQAGYTGDQDLSGYLLNTTDTFSGNLTFNGGNNNSKESFINVKRGSGAGLWLKFQTDSTSTNNVSQFVIRRSTDNVDILSISATSGNLTVPGTLSASGYNNTNWDTAYGWGDHSQVGYITGFTNTNEFTTGATFNSSNGVLTFTRNNGGDTFTVDIDGKYAESGHNHDTQYLENSYVDVDMDTYDSDKSLLLGRNLGGWSSGTKPAGAHNGFGILHVTTHVGGYATQFGFDTNQNKMWVRSKNPTSWGSWEYMYTTQDFSTTDISNWDTAYGWGDHSQAGYITGFTNTNEFTTGATFNSSDGIITFTRNNGGDTYTVDLDGRYLQLGGGTLTGDLTLSGVNPQINFNGTSDAGVDMAIKATPEGLDFYEPEDGNKIHFQILDDTGVNAAFGLQVGGTNVISSSRVLQNVTGNISMFTNDSEYLTTYNDEYTTGVTWNGSNGILTFTRNDGDTYTVDISSTLTDVTVTGGTYDDSTQTLTLTKSDSNTVDVTGFAIESVKFTTGATFNTGNGIITFTNNDATTYNVDIDSRYLQLGGGTLTGDLTVGSTSRASNTVIKALSNDDHRSGFEAYGSSQGNGYLYVGQSTTHGGGISYNGDSSPGYVDGETSDYITFYRREAGTNTEVFAFPYSSNEVYFNGNVHSGGGNSSQWNTAVGWGDHSQVGYLTGFTETDPIFTASEAFDITATNKSNWNTAYGWGNHAGRYMTEGSTLSDPDIIENGGNRYDPNANNPSNEHYAIVTFGNRGNVTGQLATHYVSGKLYSRGHNSTWSSWRTYWDDSDFTSTNVTNWNTAYGWGDHSGVYLGINDKAADSELLDGVNSTSFLRSDTADTATELTVNTLKIGSSNKIQFANNDFIRYDDSNGVGRFHFDSDGSTNNSSVQAATFVGALSGNASTASFATDAKWISFPDGPRDLTDRLPNWNNRSVAWDFVTAGTASGDGNYAGVMTFSPWDGTSSSTGDSSYQLAFVNLDGVNASGTPGLRLRNGIDTTWNDWVTLFHTGNFTDNSANWDIAHGWGDHSGLYLPIGGKAADSDLLDGINSTSFLRSDTADTISATLTMGTQKALVANNYGRGVYGIYSATRYQHVWSMGTAYNLSDDGTSSGNLYGLSFTHTNIGGQSKSGLDHQLLVMRNGVTVTALGTGVWTDGRVTTTSNGNSSEWNTAYGWGNHASGGYLTSSSTLNASNMTTGTLPDVFSSSTRYNIGFIDGSGSQSRDKIRVWDSSEYTIGMKNGYDYGHIGSGEYAMSFQMSNTSGRGWWWGDTGHNDDQGAASLTTEGKMVIAKSLSIGQGETITNPSDTPLYVEGTTAGDTVFEVQGTQGQLFSITDDLTGDLFEVSDISGIPILTVNASGTVTVDDTLHVTGDVIAYYSSDERLKDNIKPIENAMDKIKLIGGYEFDWNQSSKNVGHDVGVIAQEVEKVIPELVTTRTNGYKAVKYDKLTALLIQSNKELIEKVEELEKKLNDK